MTLEQFSQILESTSERSPTRRERMAQSRSLAKSFNRSKPAITVNKFVFLAAFLSSTPDQCVSNNHKYPTWRPELDSSCHLLLLRKRTPGMLTSTMKIMDQANQSS